MRLETLTEQEVVVTLIALMLLLGSAYMIGTLFEKLKAPRVVGEILGGMIWGGSCLYIFAPKVVNKIFLAYEQEGQVLNIFYQLGLIFLMFLSGYNTTLEVDKSNRQTITFIFVGATVIPMLLAMPIAHVFEAYFIGDLENEVSYTMVFVIGVAITSIPVISKIFFDMGIMNTKFANMVLTVSTFQDLCLWILLNTAIRIATIGVLKLQDMLFVVIFTLGLFFLVNIIANRISVLKIKTKTIDFYTINFVILLFVCAVLNMVGINIMYAAFLVGYVIKAIIGTDKQTCQRMTAVGDFAFSFFIPIYFALVGIQLNILHDFSFRRFMLFFVIAFGLEAIGTIVMLTFTKLNKTTIINFAVTMNARGGPGIVLATVAYSYRIISVEFFTVLILTTMLSSLIAGYWLRNQQRRNNNIFMNLYR